MLLVIATTTFFVLSALAIVLFLGLWTYKDAEVKSEQSPLLWTFVAVLVPNFLGIIIYLLVGRTKKDVPAPKKYLTPLIVSIAVFIISLGIFIPSIVWFAMNDTGAWGSHMTFNSGIWSGQSSHYHNGTWVVSARRGNGTMRRTHSLDENELQVFFVESDNDEGELRLSLEQNGSIYEIDLTGSVMGSFDLGELGFEPGRIRKTLHFRQATNVRTIVSWAS